MDDERDAEDAIRSLDRSEFGRQGRRLRVEWTKQERGIRRPGGSRRSAAANLRPTKTLFVINFDPVRTRTRDLEKHFDPFGKVLNIRIRRNFAFIQFESQEDATKALDATNMTKLRDRVISVEYAVRDDDDRRNGYSPERGRDRSPERRSRDRGRSPSPYRRERGSPDYGRGPSPYSKPEPRASPDYGRAESPVYDRFRSRSTSARGRSPSERERSPPARRRSPSERERSPPARGRSPPERSLPARGRSPPEGSPPERSPPAFERSSPERSPPARERSPPEISPPARERSRS